MAFLTGIFLIDAPASALNNLGSIPGSRTDNTVGVKRVRTREGYFPYVSAQAFRYWLRTTLADCNPEWKAAPVYREEKVAYADANPILYWDDDLFGYMRAPSTKASAKEKRAADPNRANETPTDTTITRVSPFRVSTLISIAALPDIPTDFGVMSRQEGDPVPHEHQFYRTTLKGLYSLDLHASGTFSYSSRTGYRNLDEIRKQQAEAAGLVHIEGEKSYRLPLESRAARIAALLDGWAQLEGGAKQALHYTDVAPVLTIQAVTKGGNNLFGHVIGVNAKGLPHLKLDALSEALTVFSGDLLSDVYVGWVRGYLDEERMEFENFVESGEGKNFSIQIGHPREAFQKLAVEMKKAENSSWLD